MRKMTFFKKSAAVAFAAAMVITAAPNVSAADPASGAAVGPSGPASSSVTGDSFMEGVLPSDVVDVVLPTTTADTYKFVLDPADLLSKYDGDKDSYTPNSVYFTNAGAPATTYSGTSDVATAVNKSTCDVILGVDVSVSNVATNPVTFTDAVAKVEADKNRNLYVALVPTALGDVDEGNDADATSTVDAQAKPVSDGAVSASFVLEGKESNFDVEQVADSSVTSGHTYKYKAKSTAKWVTAGFALTAKCNTKADWSAFNTASQDKTNGENLKVTVAYSMDVPTDAQKEELETKTPDTTTGLADITAAAVSAEPTGFSAASYTVTKGTALDMPVDLGKGSKAITVSSAKVELYVGGKWYDLSSFKGTYANGKVTIAANTTLTAGGPYNLRLTFNNDSKLAFTTKLTIK